MPKLNMPTLNKPTLNVPTPGLPTLNMPKPGLPTGETTGRKKIRRALVKTASRQVIANRFSVIRLMSKPMVMKRFSGFRLPARLAPAWKIWMAGLFLLLATGISGAVQAQFTQWNGSVSSDWFDAGNWSNGVPDANLEARINWFAGSQPEIGSSTTIRRLNMGSNNQTLTIASGATLNILQDVAIGNSGTLNVGEGAVVVNQASTVGGAIVVGSGEITFLANFTMNGSAVFTVQTGTVNIGDPGPPVVSANFTQTGGSTFNLNQGTLNIFGNSEFTGGGTFNAGSGEINLSGNIQFNGGSDFNSDESTVNISGEVTISSNSNQEANFYNLNINDDATVTSTVNVTVNNDMSVSESSDYEHQNNTTLNVVGEVSGDPQIDTERPYIISITINSQSSITAVFDQALNTGPAETASNYHVEDASGNTIDQPSNPVLGGNISNEVSLALGFSIQEGIDYFLIVNNVSNVNNQTVNANHRKRFRIVAPPTFYSRQSGDWSQTGSWATGSHTGQTASRVPGQNGDQVIIGNGHTIAVGGTVNLQPLASIMVNATGTLQVENGGTLSAGTQPVLGNGAFELLAGGTLEIGSPGGIRASGSGGNILTDSRSFSEQAHYIYNGTPVQVTGSGLPASVSYLTIDNGSGVSLSSDLTVSGTLYLLQGVLRIPSGLHLVANSKQPPAAQRNGSLLFERELTGSKGWRLMSSPVNTSFADFTIGPDAGRRITTQGFPGSDFPDEMPNILYFNEQTPSSSSDTVSTSQGWRTPGSLAEMVAPGRGYFVYVFDGAGGPGNDIVSRPDELNFTISAAGQENEPATGESGSFDFNVTRTARALYEDDTGWNLVGNPFGAALDWDASGWNKTGMHASVYVWDPSANAGLGEYLEWNGVTVSLGSGLIAPFQAFWVKAQDPGAALSVTTGAKTTGQNQSSYSGFRGKLSGSSYGGRALDFSEMGLRLHHEPSGLQTRTRLMFSDEGRPGTDPLDAYRLVPLTHSYLSLFSVRDDGAQLSINSLPARANESLSIPLEAFGVEEGHSMQGQVSLQWDYPADLSPDLSLMLLDTRTGREINMRSHQSYTFDLDASPSFSRKTAMVSQLLPAGGALEPVIELGGQSSRAHAGSSPGMGYGMGSRMSFGTDSEMGFGTDSGMGSRTDSGLQSLLAEEQTEREREGFLNRPGAPMVLHHRSKETEARFRILICKRVPSRFGEEVPETLLLEQNYPNPFNPSTTLRFALPEEARVQLAVYDLLGRRVALPAEGVYAAGVHQVTWDARGLSSGTYVYRLEAGGEVQTRKMLLVR